MLELYNAIIWCLILFIISYAVHCGTLIIQPASRGCIAHCIFYCILSVVTALTWEREALESLQKLVLTVTKGAKAT